MPETYCQINPLFKTVNEIWEKARNPDENPESYTAKAVREDIVGEKLLEETYETLFSDRPDEDGIVSEASQLLYFTSVALADKGFSPDRIYSLLDSPVTDTEYDLESQARELVLQYEQDSVSEENAEQLIGSVYQNILEQDESYEEVLNEI